MPWKLKYEKDDDMVALDFETKNQLDDYIKSNILSKNFDAVINYKNAGICAEKAFYTPDHFIPLLYMLGSCDLADNIKAFNDKCLMGAMSMTGYITQ